MPNVFPPSDVKVEPEIVGGDNFEQLTSTVTTSSFSPLFQINGDSFICSSGLYTVSNLPSGVTIESINSSNNNIATATLDTNGEITVTKVSNGTIAIAVTVENSCGQMSTRTKTIQSGDNSNLDIGGLENGINAGSHVDLSFINSNGCGEITFTSASSGLTFTYVGSDYAVLSSTSLNSGTGWVYITISGTSVYKEFPINTIPPPVIPNENYISVTRIPNNYPLSLFNSWKMVKVYYYGNSSDVDYWEWIVNNSYIVNPMMIV